MWGWYGFDSHGDFLSISLKFRTCWITDDFIDNAVNE